MLNITLPEATQAFVESETRRRGCGSASEFVGGLILEEQRRGESDRTEELLLEGLASGPGGSFDAQWAERMTARVLKGQLHA